MSILARIGSTLRPTAKVEAAMTDPASKQAMRIAKKRLKHGDAAAEELTKRLVQKRQARTGAGMVGGVGLGLGGMFAGQSSSGRRGGYGPPSLREPRGSGRHA